MITGPNIVTDGLVFGYDADDRNRFYKGEPTTNIIKLLQDLGSTCTASYGTNCMYAELGYLVMLKYKKIIIQQKIDIYKK